MSRSAVAGLFAAAIAVTLAAPVGAAPPPTLDFRLEVLSSPPEMVTGGDALVRIRIPITVPLHKAGVRLNGTTSRPTSNSTEPPGR